MKGITTKLQQHVTSANIPDVSKSGLRLGHSTESSLVALKDDFLMAMGTGKISTLILLDPSAAFDTVDHKVLLPCLHDTAEVGSPMALIIPLQQNLERWCSSLPKALTCGVPQGSRLSLFLFNSYMRARGELVRCHGLSCQ